MAKKKLGPRPTFGGSAMFPSQYISAEDLRGDHTLEIESIRKESVKTEDGQMPKWLVRFKGAQKALILNATNASAIAAVTGTAEAKQWIGKRVTIYPTTCEAFGQTVPCIRVRPTAPRQSVPSQPETIADDGPSLAEEYAMDLEALSDPEQIADLLARAEEDQRLTAADKAKLVKLAARKGS